MPAEVVLPALTTPALIAVLALMEMRDAGLSLTLQASEVHSPCLAHQE